MIPYGRQFIDERDIDSVVKILKSDFLAQGPACKQFEEELAKYCGCKYAVAVSNGTTALHLAYLSLGLEEGDEVITTPNTFVATTNMLMAVGVKPIFCDIRLDTNNIDESKIEKLITERTKAIVPVHFAGHPCDIAQIRQIAKKYDLRIIEDSAHAVGAKIGEEYVGGEQTDIATFSFHPVKIITTGEGGAVVTNSEDIYSKIKHLRSHGIRKDENGFNVMTELGYNYRITDIQASLGVSQLEKIEKFIKKRHDVVDLYYKELDTVENIILPKELFGYYSAWHLFVIRTKDVSDRMTLYKYLQKSGVGVNFHYPCVYSHPYYRNNGYEGFSLPNAELYHNTAITLPIYFTLEEDRVKYVCDKIKEYFRNK